MRSSPEELGLCTDCRHTRRVRSGKGSVFLLCRRSEDDPTFPRYPRLPVTRCSGYETAAGPSKASGGFWRRHWFLAGLLVVVAGGVLFPEGGQALRRAGLVLPLLTATTLFLSGFALETAQLRFSSANGTALLLGLGSTYLAAPALAYALVLLVGPPIGAAGSEGHLFLEAMMIAAAQAGTIASAPALTVIAGGNQALALLVTVSSNVLTVVLTPLILRLSLGANVAFPTAEMMARMFFVVLLPVIGGQCVRRFAWARFREALPVVRVASQAIILVFVYTGVSAAADEVSARLDLILRLLLVAATLHLLLLGLVFAGSNLLGLEPPSRTALMFCGTQKTLPNGIYLWDRFFSANPHGALAMVQYHVFQLVVDTLLVPWLSGRRAAPG